MSVMKLMKVSNDSRLHKLHKRWFYAHKKYDQTWCELFKTESYKRMELHKEFIRIKIINYVNFKYKPTDNTWAFKKLEDTGWCLVWYDGESK